MSAIIFTLMRHAEGPFLTAPFDHRQHVKFAWCVLAELAAPEAEDFVAEEIRSFARVHAPWRHYSRMSLSASDARATFVEPDLRPMP